jgi:hypothetical protein
MYDDVGDVDSLSPRLFGDICKSYAANQHGQRHDTADVVFYAES